MNPGFVSVGDPKSLRTAIDRRRAAKVADAQEHVRHLSKKCGETQINVIVNWLPHDDKRTSQELASNGRGMHLDTFAPFSVSVPPLIEKISYNAT